MSTAPLSVLLVTRDPDVKLVAASLQADGITSRTVAGLRDLNRALSGARGENVVAVFDGDIGGDPSFPIADVFERLRAVPMLVLLSTEADGRVTGDPLRSSAEEFERKPIVPSVLSLRIKALALAAGLTLPAPVAPAAPAAG